VNDAANASIALAIAMQGIDKLAIDLENRFAKAPRQLPPLSRANRIQNWFGGKLNPIHQDKKLFLIEEYSPGVVEPDRASF